VLKTSTPVPPAPILWPDLLLRLVSVVGDASTSTSTHPGYLLPAALTDANSGLEVFVQEVENSCRAETKQLYSAEGKASMLSASGIPESLNVWLVDMKDKIFGTNGHREKSWRKLWQQTDLFEELLARKAAVGDEDDSQFYVSKLCIQLTSYSFSLGLRTVVSRTIEQFAKTLPVWEKGREKHERQLRPRLASPDAVDELSALDAIESQRSTEYNVSTKKVQSSVFKSVANTIRVFCEDTADLSRLQINLLDSSVCLDLLQVPPDTEVIRKKLTLKRLRKVQRIRDAVANGGEDLSKNRVWPGLPVDPAVSLIRSVESLVLAEEREFFMKAAAAIPDAAAALSTKTKAPDKKGIPEAVTVGKVEASFINSIWLQNISERSCVNGLVSSAHRIVIAERDAAINRFITDLQHYVDGNTKYFDKLLSEEISWSNRWNRQVNMLKHNS